MGYASAKGLIEKIRQNLHERFRHMLVMFLSNHRPSSMPKKNRGSTFGSIWNNNLEVTTKHVCKVKA
jgi:hypothetical protein